MNLPLYVPVSIFGLTIGSFMNVVIHRLPRRQSIVRPRSSCTTCGRFIRWYENVPVLSYLVLRGRCSGCGAPISIRYPFVELFGGGLAVIVLWRYGPNLHALFAFSFLMALLAVTIIDWKHRIIPDEISISFILIGIAWSFFDPALSPWESSLGALVGGGGLYGIGVLYRMLRRAEGMGGGDVKLMAMIGAFLGVKLVLPVIVIASFAGSIYGLFFMRGERGGKASVAFGSFLAPAAALCLFWGTTILAWYFGHF
jgi:leader peptidase (prepilin peptidase)/N-methyltransferase